MSYHYLGREWEAYEKLEARAQGNDKPNSDRSPLRSLSQRMGCEDDGFTTEWPRLS